MGVFKNFFGLATAGGAAGAGATYVAGEKVEQTLQAVTDFLKNPENLQTTIALAVGGAVGTALTNSVGGGAMGATIGFLLNTATNMFFQAKPETQVATVENTPTTP